MLVAFLFLEGQLLFCCELTEALAEKIIALTSHSNGHHGDGHSHSHPATDKPPEREDCHTKGKSGKGIQNPETCISESQSQGTMLGNSNFGAPVQLAWISDTSGFKLIIVKAEHPEPWPRNKSSPPVYLTTLRILV